MKSNLNTTKRTAVLTAGVLVLVASSALTVVPRADEAVATPRPVVKNDPKLDRELLEALQDNDELSAAEALQNGASPNARDKGGNTALLLAVQSGKASLVKQMLAVGADATAVNKNKQSGLHLATTIGAPKPRKKHFGGFGGLLGGAAMGAAVSGGLGDFGASGAWAGNLLGSGGFDSLLGANLDGFLRGGVFNLAGKSGWSAIVGTALQGDLRANGLYGLQNLMTGGVPGLGFSAGRLDAAGWIGLASSVKSSNPQVLGVMSSLPGGNPRWSEFMAAASAGHRAEVETMLADPALQPLLEQAGQGMSAAAMDLPGNAAKTIISDLLAAGTDPALTDKNGDTAAKLAEKRGWEDVVKLLNTKPEPAAANATTTTTATTTATTTEVKAETAAPSATTEKLKTEE